MANVDSTVYCCTVVISVDDGQFGNWQMLTWEIWFSSKDVNFHCYRKATPIVDSLSDLMDLCLIIHTASEISKLRSKETSYL